MLEEIESKLQTIDDRVYYGIVDNNDINLPWNYTVFSRKSLSASESKKAYSDYFEVAIVRENYIPEGLDVTVIEKMCEIAGVRLANPNSQYQYTMKPNTNTVVELLIMEFVKARKRVE